MTLLMQLNHMLILAVGLMLVLSKRKKGSMSTSTGARWEQATRRANKNSKVLRMRDESWSESEGSKAGCVDHQVRTNVRSSLIGWGMRQHGNLRNRLESRCGAHISHRELDVRCLLLGSSGVLFCHGET